MTAFELRLLDNDGNPLTASPVAVEELRAAVENLANTLQEEINPNRRWEAIATEVTP